MIRQALEWQADQIGINIARQAVARILVKAWPLRQYSLIEQQMTHRVFAAVLCTGANMAVALFTPKRVVWEDLSAATHPPALMRFLGLSSSLSRAIADGLLQIDEASRRLIRIKSLNLAFESVIEPGSSQDAVYQAALARGELAAHRAVGFEELLTDENAGRYAQKLDISLNSVRHLLLSRMI
jgi:hypothetical protein